MSSRPNPDTPKEIVQFVHKVHPVFAVTISTLLHMLCGWNDDTMPTLNLFGVHLKCFSIWRSFSWKKWNPFVTDEFPYETLILRKRLSVLCTKRTISFEISGFHTETRLLQRDFIFLNLFEFHSFSVFKMHHSKTHHQFSTFSDFICYFSCIYWFFWAIRPWNWKAFQMNSEKVESWHGIIISPT